VHCALKKVLRNEFVLQHSELLDYSIKDKGMVEGRWVTKTVHVLVLKDKVWYEYELHETCFENCAKTLSLVLNAVDCENTANFAYVTLNLNIPAMILEPEAFMERWMLVFTRDWNLCAGSAPLQLQGHAKQQEFEKGLQRNEAEMMSVLGTAVVNPDRFSDHFFFRSEIGVHLWRYFIVQHVLIDFTASLYKSNY